MTGTVGRSVPLLERISKRRSGRLDVGDDEIERRRLGISSLDGRACTSAVRVVSKDERIEDACTFLVPDGIKYDSLAGIDGYLLSAGDLLARTVGGTAPGQEYMVGIRATTPLNLFC